MSGTAENLARKISSAHDLAGVVRSMKALAASSIGQYEEAAESLNDYYRTVELGLSACLREAMPAPPISKAAPGSPASIGVIIFGSDQGLVGRFNETIVDYAGRTLKEIPGRIQQIWAVGDRVQSLAVDAEWPAAVPLRVPAAVELISPLVGKILIDIEAARERGSIGKVYLFHNRPTTAAAYEPVGRRLLPLDAAWVRGLAAVPWPTRTVPEIIDGTAPVLEALVRNYLFVLLFRACAESLASENASRLAAMQRAQQNIDDVVEDLERKFHRVRQESIDEELFEVVSGSESISRRSHRASRPV